MMKDDSNKFIRIKALQSLKNISSNCYDISNQTISTNEYPLLCMTQSFRRSLPKQSQTIQSSNTKLTPCASSSRVRAFSARKNTSIYKKDFEGLSETMIFCKKVYTMKATELNAKHNMKQQQIFTKKFSKTITDKEINATGNDLGPLGIKEICNYLIASKIEVLILDKNNLKDQGIITLAKIIGRLKLRMLSLVSVNMEQKGCCRLIHELKNIQTLQHLNISSFEGFNRNKLHNKSLEQIEYLVSGNKCNLTHLNISNTGINDKSFIYLSKGLTKNSCLKQLDVSHNEITAYGMDIFKESIKYVNLHCFNCSYNKIKQAGLKVIGQLIGTNYSLTKLSTNLKILKINGNNIRSEALQILCQQLIVNQTLQELYLDDNPLGQGKMLTAFIYFIKKNWSLKKLSLTHSLRCTEDILAFCESLEINRGIHTLILSDNNIEYCSFKTLMEVVVRNKCLRKIHLAGCRIVDSFILKTQEIILQLKSLEEIHMEHNFITDKGAAIIERTIFRNKLISKFTLYNNGLSAKMMKAIQLALKHNRQSKKNEGPDMTYYTYLEQMHNDRKTFLNEDIVKLKQKTQKLQYRQLIRQIAHKQIEQSKIEFQKKKEIEQLSDVLKSAEGNNLIKWQASFSIHNNEDQQTFITTQL